MIFDGKEPIKKSVEKVEGVSITGDTNSQNVWMAQQKSRIDGISNKEAANQKATEQNGRAINTLNTKVDQLSTTSQQILNKLDKISSQESQNKKELNAKIAQG